jgi:ribosomal protein S18 acetylase RimI-like enzyme
MGYMLEIRFATRHDVPIILTFIKQLAESLGTTSYLEATASRLEETLFGEKPYAEVILGSLNNKPVSYILFLHNYSTLYARPGLYIVDLYVLSDVRKQKVATKMLSYAAQIAQQRQCCRMEWSVPKRNHIAKALYRKVGALTLDEWENFRLNESTFANLASLQAVKHKCKK